MLMVEAVLQYNCLNIILEKMGETFWLENGLSKRFEETVSYICDVILKKFIMYFYTHSLPLLLPFDNNLITSFVSCSWLWKTSENLTARCPMKWVKNSLWKEHGWKCTTPRQVHLQGLGEMQPWSLRLECWLGNHSPSHPSAQQMTKGDLVLA